jgi:putative ATP-binding cassette transporter
MYVLELLRTSPPKGLRKIVIITCLAGLANAILISLINVAAGTAARGEGVGLRLALLYAAAFGIFYVANLTSLREANGFMQERLGELRVRLADKIRRADLRSLEQVGRGDIYAIVAQEINQLSQNFPLLISAAQSVFLLVFCLAYIATLSQISFVVVSFATVLGLIIFLDRRAALNQVLVTVHARETEMLDSLTHFTEGFQEMRLNADKNDALFERFTAVVGDVEEVVVGVGGRWVGLLMFSNAFLYALLGVVVLALPMFFQGYTDVIYKIAAASIFCVGPVMALTSAAPMYSRADVGLGHVFRLEARLDRGVAIAAADRMPSGSASRFREFRRIEFEAASFSYANGGDAVTFRTGPWDIAIERGETVFIVGGNGSGKSTTLKLLCGLYPLEAGRILVDGVCVDRASQQDYRELFSCVFADFHLFDRLHGLEDVDGAAVRDHIERMELTGKVDFADGRFSTLNLSTGQRKRLAMIVSLLEDREIYIFDEWAADQDSHFRDVFYTGILPELKHRGKTVIAVTHDDRYWDRCDRMYTMDLGVMARESAEA